LILTGEIFNKKSKALTDPERSFELFLAAVEMQGGETFKGKYVVKKQYLVPPECIFV
jgi:hypothetical protein